MRNVGLVIKHEIKTTLRRKSFWIMTFLMPVILLGFQVYNAVEASSLELDDGDSGTEETASKMPVIGLVDEARLIKEFPEEFPPKLFLPFDDQTDAHSALERNEIDRYVIIPLDYMQTGEINVFEKDFKILVGENSLDSIGAQGWMLDTLIKLNISGDPELITAMNNPISGSDATHHALIPTETVDERTVAMGKIIARVLPYMFYFVLLIGSGYVLQSVASEKENRTVELLLVTLNPRELMFGKIIGLSIVTLIQVVIWFGGGVLILDRGKELLDVAGFAFPPGFLFWAISFLMLGYLLFASIMAAAGALAPTAREGNQVVWLLVLPLMPTLVLGVEPDNIITIVLSLFPLSAPSAMVTRLALGDVPFWQTMVSFLGLAITTYLMIGLAARFFQSGNLLSNAQFKWKKFITGWKD